MLGPPDRGRAVSELQRLYFLKRGSCKKNRRHTLMYFFGFRGNNSDTENMIGKVPNYKRFTTIRTAVWPEVLTL